MSDTKKIVAGIIITFFVSVGFYLALISMLGDFPGKDAFWPLVGFSILAFLFKKMPKLSKTLITIGGLIFLITLVNDIFGFFTNPLNPFNPSQQASFSSAVQAGINSGIGLLERQIPVSAGGSDQKLRNLHNDNADALDAATQSIIDSLALTGLTPQSPPYQTVILRIERQRELARKYRLVARGQLPASALVPPTPPPTKQVLIGRPTGRPYKALMGEEIWFSSTRTDTLTVLITNIAILVPPGGWRGTLRIDNARLVGQPVHALVPRGKTLGRREILVEW